MSFYKNKIKTVMVARKPPNESSGRDETHPLHSFTRLLTYMYGEVCCKIANCSLFQLNYTNINSAFQ